MAKRTDATMAGLVEGEGSQSPIRLHALVAEFLGTFFIEFIAGACTIASAQAGLVPGALGIGFSFTAVMFVMRGVSGAHLNPAVTMGIMVSQPPLAYEFNLIQGIAYIFCQFFGSILGAVLCAHLIPMGIDGTDQPATEGGNDAGAVPHTPGSVTFMTRGVLSGDHGVSVFIFELICTFAIVWVFFATMIDHRSRKRTGGFGPVAVGLGIIVGVLAEGPGTGASMSPARTIAPAIALGIYSHLVAPLLGTMFGGLVAGMMYSYLYLFKPEQVPDAYRITCEAGQHEAELYQAAQWE